MHGSDTLECLSGPPVDGASLRPLLLSDTWTCTIISLANGPMDTVLSRSIATIANQHMLNAWLYEGRDATYISTGQLYLKYMCTLQHFWQKALATTPSLLSVLCFLFYYLRSMIGPFSLGLTSGQLCFSVSTSPLISRFPSKASQCLNGTF